MHDLLIDLLNVLLGGGKLFLEPDFLLLELVLGALREFRDKVFDFHSHVSPIHRVHNVIAVGVELGRENF